MIPITILCGCGQKYTFDVEPINGQMPSTVACPTCGADGTAAGNEAIAMSMPAQPALAAVGGGSLRLSRSASADVSTEETTPAPAAPRRGPGRLPGQVDRSQAETEARAKTSWGDPPEEVLKYLMIQGYSHAEASDLVKELFKERAAEIRVNGIKKIVLGVILICVPVVVLFIFLSIGYIYPKLLAMAVMVGLWGLWQVFKGIFMVVAPRMEGGDVAEH